MSLPSFGLSARAPETTVPEHIQDCAEQWQEMHGTYWKSRALLLGWVSDHGPIRLSDGRLCGFQPDGFQFDSDAVGREFPALVKNAEVKFEGRRENIERLIEMAVEELPDLDYVAHLTIDATAANAMIRAGGEAAERLLPHRVAKNKLGVR